MFPLSANSLNSALSEDLRLLLDLRHHDPAQILGRHVQGSRCTVRVRIPGARAAWLLPLELPLNA